MNAGPSSPERRARHGDSQDAHALAEVFNRFTFDSGRRGRRRRHELPHSEAPQEPPEPEEPVYETRWPTDEPQGQPRHAWQEEPADEEPATYIRPYAWTGGRTRSSHPLELETLVSTSELCRTARLERLEHHSIADLCHHPRSVAEVGAILHVPLGVTRVLLGDMADLGLITVHRTVTENGSTPHLMLMERVLSGLRRL